MAVFVAAIRIPDHPSKGVNDGHKGEQTNGGGARRPYFDRYRSIFAHHSSYIEL
jgi:hypothetical protein